MAAHPWRERWVRVRELLRPAGPACWRTPSAHRTRRQRRPGDRAATYLATSDLRRLRADRESRRLSSRRRVPRVWPPRTGAAQRWDSVLPLRQMSDLFGTSAYPELAQSEPATVPARCWHDQKPRKLTWNLKWWPAVRGHPAAEP